MQPAYTGTRRTEAKLALATCRPGLIGLGVLTITLSLLPIAFAIYALMIFDVVLASHSGATLAGLFVMIVVLLGIQTFLAMIREKLFAQVGAALTFHLDNRVDMATARAIETTASPGDGLQSARDLDAIRHFLSGRGAAAYADVPAVLFFVLVMVVFHAYLALALLVVAAVMVGLLVTTLRGSVEPARERSVAIADRNASIDLGFRHAELIRVLGMRARAAVSRQSNMRRTATVEQQAAEAIATRAAVAAGIRLIAQAALLGIGGWLAIEGRASAGVIVAAALLGARALKPLEDAIAHAREYALARQGWQRIGAMLAAVPPEDNPLPLPAPAETLSVEAVSVAIPESRRIVLRDISFALKAGDGVSVVGQSAAGKSTLLRAIVGAWRPVAGTVRLDGGALDQWQPEALGRHVGYLPQSIELFDGTVAQNIARFDPVATSDMVIAAATAAGVHDMIVRLPDGYGTELGPGGMRLSAGERQRIAFARALYGDPFVIALDEPASFADGIAQAALAAAMRAAMARGAIVVAVGNSASSVDPANKILVLREGRVQDFGPKDEVRARLAQPRAPVAKKPIVAAAPAQE